MNITLLQTDLHWEDSKANLASIEQQLSRVTQTDLIVLPEMFNTAFSSRSSELAQAMDGLAVRWMQAQAKLHKAIITGSIMIAAQGKYYNRMLWVKPDGQIEHYDKRHLFRMAGEHEHFAQGQERVIVEVKGVRVLLQVCYDLRFPVYSRNRYMDGRYEYDLVLYVANWPSPRHHAWSGLLRARAMENLAYCAGVNRIGSDANGLDYTGGSALIDYIGHPIIESEQKSGLFSADIDMAGLKRFRDKFPTGMDADPFTFSA